MQFVMLINVKMPSIVDSQQSVEHEMGFCYLGASHSRKSRRVVSKTTTYFRLNYYVSIENLLF